MQFVYTKEIQYIVNNGFAPSSLLTDVRNLMDHESEGKIYFTPENYPLYLERAASYVGDRWDNYYSQLPNVAETIDIVYPYYNPRRGETDDSLKYSIRSAVANLNANFTIWVVGDQPSWISRQVNYISKERFGEHPRRKSIDSMMNMLLAMNNAGMGDKVLIMNDDQYFVNQTPVEVFRHPGVRAEYTFTELQDWQEGNNWEFTRKKTMMAYLTDLGDRDATAKDYSSHMPYLYDKTNFLTMAAKWQMDQCHVLPNNQGVYCPEIMYYNEYPFEATPPPLLEKVYIFQDAASDTTTTQLIGKSYVLNNPPAAYNLILNRLKSLFPEKSIYER